jgi:hypothetical protein
MVLPGTALLASAPGWDLVLPPGYVIIRKVTLEPNFTFISFI